MPTKGEKRKAKEEGPEEREAHQDRLSGSRSDLPISGYWIKTQVRPCGMGTRRNGLLTLCTFVEMCHLPSGLIWRPRKGDLLRDLGKNAGAGKRGNSD
jgi:hypothetical protein